MNIVCLDLEGVLVPEIWIAFAKASNIPELKRTTRDEPDYDKFINKAKKYSIYNIDIMPKYGEKILTLSTCDNSRGDDYRFVVFAVELAG